MKRSTRIGSIALAVAATTVAMGSIPAQADPTITATFNGVAVAGGPVQLPGTLVMTGTGCTINGLPATMGQFVSMEGDPWTTPGFKAYETDTDIDGSMVWTSTLESDEVMDFTAHSRWYCASASPESIHDDAMLWVGEEIVATVRSDGNVLPLRATADASSRITTLATTKTATSRGAGGARLLLLGGAPTSVAQAPTMTMTSDPEALPAIDEMGITGPVAARLKASIDARYRSTTSTRVLMTLRRLAGRNVNATAAIDARLDELYVTTAHSVIGTAKPSARTIDRSTDLLDRGVTKVAVIEDIALTVRPASWWNARG